MRSDKNRPLVLLRRCAVALGAALLAGGVALAAPQQARGHELRFEGWAEDVQPLLASGGALAPFAPHVEHDVIGVRLDYTTHYRGDELTVSGLVVFPIDLEGPAPILVWNHGTLFDEHRGPSSWRNPARLQLIPAFSGMITFMPDYVGYGATAGQHHPYIMRADIVPSVIDMIHAGREFLAREGIEFSDELHLWGHSEGGYVALATGYELDTNPDHGLTVTEVHASAGPYDVEEAARVITLDESYPIPGYVAFLLASYNQRYWERPSSEFFRAPYADLVERFQVGSAKLPELVGGMPATLGELLQPAFRTRFGEGAEEGIAAAMRANSIPPWAPATRIVLYHGTEDVDVPFPIGEKQYAAMVAAGADPARLSFVAFEGADHSATIFRAVQKYLELED